MNKDTFLFETKLQYEDKIRFGALYRQKKFIYNNKCYTKIDVPDSVAVKGDWGGMYKYNAINLLTGELEFFDEETMVYEVYSNQISCKSGIEAYSKYVSMISNICIILLIDCLIIGVLHVVSFWFFIKVIIFITTNLLMFSAVYYNTLDKIRNKLR